jgi:hypothetical protein
MAKDPGFYKDCAAILGPNQPSITTPDPTSTGGQFASTQQESAKQESSSKKSAPEAKKPEQSAPDRTVPNVKDKVDDVTKKLDKDALRKRAIERLRKALEKGNQDVEKLRKRLEDQLGVKLPKVDDLPKPPGNPSAPTPTFPTPGGGGGGAPPVPSVPGVLLDYLFAP